MKQENLSISKNICLHLFDVFLSSWSRTKLAEWPHLLFLFLIWSYFQTFLFLTVAVLGVVCTGVSYLVLEVGGNLVQLSMSFVGAAFGPVTGVFFLGALVPFANWKVRTCPCSWITQELLETSLFNNKVKGLFCSDRVLCVEVYLVSYLIYDWRLVKCCRRGKGTGFLGQLLDAQNILANMFLVINF